jgi:hypothetical protein
MYARGKFTAYNCDVVMNLATESTGGIFNENHHNKYYNCILWGNIAAGQPNQADGTSDYEYCAVQGGVNGTGIINLPASNSGQEPGVFVRFIHPAETAGADYYNDDWTVNPRSICVNAGKPNTTGVGSTDIYGNPRLQKGRIDIGAYESCASLTLVEDYMVEGEEYLFFDNLLTAPGYYTHVLEGQDCDSVIGLTLMVLDGMEEFGPSTGSGTAGTFVVWPNPTNGIVHIEADEIQKVEVYNLVGQRIMSTEKTETIDLNNLEKGVYFLIVSNKNGTKSVGKVIKE